MGKLITIDDLDIVSRGGNGGLIPRDFQSHPVGCYAVAPRFDDSLLIPEKDWDDLIRQQEADKSSLQHLGDSQGIQALDQDGQGYCVIPGTQISMANGSKKPVELVKVGEEVITAEGDTGIVRKTISRLTSEPLLILEVEGQELLLTGEHPVLTKKESYLPAWALQVGEIVAYLPQKTPGWATIKSIKRKPYDGAVFNLSVSGDNSYVAEGVGVHNCWAYSTTMAVMLVRAREGQAHIPLSGHMIGCLVKGYRDEGGWNGESLEFAVKNGIASQAFWPQDSMSKSNDTQAMRLDAALHKVTEFWDLSDRADEVRQQLGSLLLMNVPVMTDFNHWSHSVCAVRLIKRDPFTIRIRNSWGDSWSDNGYGDMVGYKAIPNGAAAPRASKAE